MTFLIGGFSAQQYKSYLIQTPTENKISCKVGHSIAHLHLSCFPTIAILVNRLAYFILHHFKVCPNNTYLFQKFKSHAFTKINTQTEYNVAKEIFTLFQNCPSLDPTQLKEIETQLYATEKLLKSEEAGLSEEEEDVSVDEEVDDNQEDQKHALSKKIDEETEAAKLAKINIQKGNSEKVDDVLGDTEVIEDNISEEGSSDSDEDVFDAEFDDLFPSESENKFKSPSFDTSKDTTILKDAQLTQHNLSKKRPTRSEESGGIEGDLFFYSSDDDSDDSMVKTPKVRLDPKFAEHASENELEATRSPLNLSRQLEDIETDESSDEAEESANESNLEWLPLPPQVIEVIKKGFPFNDLKTINDLFLKKNKSRLLEYQNHLDVLLRFENKLRTEKTWTEDDGFQECIDHYRDAFIKAFDIAFEQTPDLHKKFTEKFSNSLAELGENGEMLCSVDQFKWVFGVIAHHFPAYALAFDAPSFDIYQTHQLTALVRAIFVGPNAHLAAPAVETSCLIYIKETVNKHTPVLKFDANRPLSKKSSFIHSYFVGPSGKIPTEASSLKKQLQGLAKSYVNDWLKRDGAILKFGVKEIAGGHLFADIPAGKWVEHMRDHYTQTLKSMDAHQLNEEIQKAYDCPLIRLAAQAYVEDLSEEVWITSRFPKELMEKIFDRELQHAEEEEIWAGIENLINDACFKEPEDIGLLANLAGVSKDAVESLIRIRVFYILCCLGQNAIEPVVRDLNRRVKHMDDSTASATEMDSALMCQSGERVLHFNDTFDALQITVKTAFKDPNKVHVVAQGQSVMKVKSISEYSKSNIEAGIIELKGLSFSFSSSLAQMRYLVAQVAPQTLVVDVQNLKETIFEWDIYKKVLRFEEEKKRHNDARSIVQRALNFNQFPSKSFQDADQDVKSLNIALREVGKLKNALNTKTMLIHMNQINSNDLSAFKDTIEAIRDSYIKIIEFLKEVYSDDDHQNKVNQLMIERTKLLEASIPDINIQRSISEDSIDSSGSSSPLSMDEEEVIGKHATSSPKNMLIQAVTYFTGETTKVKYLTWKIERYEDLILASQATIRQYIELQSEWETLDKLLSAAGQADRPEWMNQILPLLKYCNKTLRIDTERLTPEYLEEVRKAYMNEMLLTLRNAAMWAKKHPHMPGTGYVNAMCHQLYTTIDINARCESVFKTFVRLGENAMSKKGEAVPSDPRYALIADLDKLHHAICAVPFDAKAPVLNQIGNSLKGHFNVAFDPNMQSNPMHVICNRVIKGEDEERLVKDIAMGTPTIENGMNAVQIAPEFEGMLRHYQEKGLVHLYINNQNFIPKGVLSLGGDESHRCQALHDLAENHFKDTLHVITLNQNSSFYHQKYDISKITASLSGIRYVPELGAEEVKEALLHDLIKGKAKDYLPSHLIMNEILQKWMKNELNKIHKGDFNECFEFNDEAHREDFIQDFHMSLRKHVEDWLKDFPAPNGETFGYSPCYSGASEFKEELVKQIFDGDRIKTGNYISTDLVKKYDLRNWSLTTIHEIHVQLFGGRADLKVEERRIFIRLFYHNLSRKILIETKANSSNVSCKDRIDRGAASDSEDYAYLAILANCMNEPHVIDFFKTMIFSRAIIVRKRSIIEERLERLIETVRFMIRHQERLQALHHTLFPGIEVTIDQFTPKNVIDEINIAEID